MEERTIGHTTVYFGDRGGRYPHGNTLLVRGPEAALVIDPSLGMVPRRDRLPAVDLVVNSHCHEDHIAGNHLYPNVPWHLHELDAPGIRSLEGLLAIYGFEGEFEDAWKQALVDQFHFVARPDAGTFEGGHVFDLGGGVTVTAIHTPGHTRGHCALWIEPDGILYLGDIELSSFGPYYGDAWSCLEDFERSIGVVRDVEARHWATFHHIGVLDEREAFLERLGKFAAVIARREERLLEFLGEPRTKEEITAHRFVYRPGDDIAWADHAEWRSMSQHLERLVEAGRVREVETGRYLAV